MPICLSDCSGGQQSPNRTSFCLASVLTSLEGGPCKCWALVSVTAPNQGTARTYKNYMWLSDER